MTLSAAWFLKITLSANVMLMNANDVPNLSPLTKGGERREKKKKSKRKRGRRMERGAAWSGEAGSCALTRRSCITPRAE